MNSLTPDQVNSIRDTYTIMQLSTGELFPVKACNHFDALLQVAGNARGNFTFGVWSISYNDYSIMMNTRAWLWEAACKYDQVSLALPAPRFSANNPFITVYNFVVKLDESERKQRYV